MNHAKFLPSKQQEELKRDMEKAKFDIITIHNELMTARTDEGWAKLRAQVDEELKRRRKK